MAGSRLKNRPEVSLNVVFKDEENQMAEDEAENSGSNKIVFSFLQAWSFQNGLSCIQDTVSFMM